MATRTGSHDAGAVAAAAPAPGGGADAGDVLHRLLAVSRGPATAVPAPPVLVIGRVLALRQGLPLVAYLESEREVCTEAATIVPLDVAQIGREVALAFDAAGRAIVLGALVGPELPLPAAVRPAVEVQCDGRHLVVEARERLTLRCGEASITLTSAGKVLIEGRHVLSRSSGTNRIKGGSIQLN